MWSDDRVGFQVLNTRVIAWKRAEPLLLQQQHRRTVGSLSEVPVRAALPLRGSRPLWYLNLYLGEARHRNADEVAKSGLGLSPDLGLLGHAMIIPPIRLADVLRTSLWLRPLRLLAGRPQGRGRKPRCSPYALPWRGVAEGHIGMQRQPQTSHRLSPRRNAPSRGAPPKAFE